MIENKENSIVTSKCPQNTTIDELVEAFYKVKKEISLIGYHTTSKTKALSERKYIQITQNLLYRIMPNPRLTLCPAPEHLQSNRNSNI